MFTELVIDEPDDESKYDTERRDKRPPQIGSQRKRIRLLPERDYWRRGSVYDALVKLSKLGIFDLTTASRSQFD